MKSVLILLAACSATAVTANIYNDKSSLFSEGSIHGHKVLASEVGKHDRKWILFPEQKAIHDRVVHGESMESITESALLPDDKFWDTFGPAFGLEQRSRMMLVGKWELKGTFTVTEKYDQFVDGVRVFGGEFTLTIGLHGGVLRAQGFPLIIPEISTDKLSVLKDVNEINLLLSMNEYIGQRFNILDPECTTATPIQVVWHNSLVAVGKQGKVALAYHINGLLSEYANGVYLAYDAFISVESGKVLQFIEKSEKAVTSPFKSPINNATIFVYDQYLKDFNDDKDDSYYYSDPDRYSNYTLVFSTEENGYVYPTTDSEMNALIDNTLYVKFMYYSLSGGEYLTWARNETNLNIEYNLTISNAYFDGTWGIHFGSGYITDDVISHEWSHGYSQTGCGLIYAFESGAMNEAFSDIFGESVDILNRDTVDPDALRTVWPTSCHKTLNSAYGIPSGNDRGTRWSMGENVTTSYPNGDGSIRDMYKPECFFHPSTTDADYYSCTTYADGGGVHKNSGVLNRLYSILVDGGQYADPGSTTGGTLTVNALGFTKATNLFWRAHQQLVPTSKYIDLALTLQAVCEENIGATLYFPNVFNYSLIVSEEFLTFPDCNNVATAIAGSGIASTADFCPNIACLPDNIYDCMWVNCSATDSTLFYEGYDYAMGYDTSGSIQAVCASSGLPSTFARSFNQSIFIVSGISCIQFGYYMMGQTTVTLSVYIDSTGGEPDWASMRLLGAINVTTINAVGQFQMQTASFTEELKVSFNSAAETIVVVLKTPVMSEGNIYGGGSVNGNYVNTVGATYVGGDCRNDFVSYYSYANNSNQWYVSLSVNVAAVPSYVPSSYRPSSNPSSDVPTLLGDTTDPTSIPSSDFPSSSPSSHEPSSYMPSSYRPSSSYPSSDVPTLLGDTTEPTLIPSNENSSAQIICPTNFSIFNNSCYKYYNNLATWQEALNQCTQEGGTLAIIDTSTENSFISSQLIDVAWIGLRDINTEGIFVWSEGQQLTYTNWNTNQPSAGSAGNSRDCVIMYPGGKWSDTLCSNSYAFICENKNASTSMPSVSPSEIPPPTVISNTTFLSTSSKITLSFNIKSFYVSLIIAFFAAIIALYVYYKRTLFISQYDSEVYNTIVPLTMVQCCGPVLVGVISVVSSLENTARDSSIGMRIAVYGVVFFSFLIAAFIICHFYGFLSSLGDMKGRVNSALAYESGFWIIVICLCFLELNIISLLPWNSTPLCCRLQGIPTIYMFKWISFTSLAKSAVLSAASLVFSSSNELSTFISFGSSVAMLLFNALAIKTILFGEKLIEEDLAVLPSVDVETMRSRATGLSMRTIFSDPNNKNEATSVELLRAELERRKIEEELRKTEYNRHMADAELATKAAEEKLQEERRMLQELQRLVEERPSREERRSIDLHNSIASSSSKQFTTAKQFADENIELKDRQIIELGSRPIEYRPLEEIKSEITELIEKANNGQQISEDRLDYLLQCMQWNKEYILEQELEMKRWRETNLPYIDDCVLTMRGFIPADRSKLTTAELKNTGLSTTLIKRILGKKCLWLLRMPASEIAKMHIADLSGTYGYDGQQLDIVELCAVYGSLINIHFQADNGGRKHRLRSNIENSVKEMITAYESGKLEKRKMRNPAYKDQIAPYQGDTEFWSINRQEQEESTNRDSLDVQRNNEHVSSFDSRNQSLDTGLPVFNLFHTADSLDP